MNKLHIFQIILGAVLIIGSILLALSAFALRIPFDEPSLSNYVFWMITGSQLIVFILGILGVVKKAEKWFFGCLHYLCY
jgi:hypothetical protein